MRNRIALLACLASVMILLAPACADVVIDWNNVTLNIITETNLRPTLGSRSLAMVHAAIYDAVNSIEATHESYHVQAPVETPASPEAAAAVAAHDVLVGLFPTREAIYDQALEASLSQIAPGLAKDNGIAVGTYVSESILAWRTGDHSDEVHPYTVETAPGVWRPTPPGYAGPVGVNWPYVTPFALLSADQFQPAPPPALDSRAYAEAVFEVQVLGERNSRWRTRDQTEIAWFWADDFGGVSPVGRWSLVAQIISKKKHLTLEQNARLFALLNIALADSCIAAWDCKYKYNLWRPITAIREADTDGNYFTVPVRAWDSLLPNPAFAEFVSGHSSFGGAAARILALFCRTDNVAFTLESTHPLAAARRFKSFSQANHENGRSRIYAGIHFRFADISGQALGRKVGDYVWSNYMRPVQ